MHSLYQLCPLERPQALLLMLVAAALALVAGCATASRERGLSRDSYPLTAKTNQTEVCHGIEVTDSYRWLEDDRAPATAAWVEEQNVLTRRYLDAIPERAGIQKRLTELWNYEKYSVPSKRGGRYFFSRNSGLQNQGVLYTAATLDAEPSILLDPNALSAEGTIALSGTAVSEDGQWLAYGLAASGSDWQEWRVRNIQTGQDLPDLLRWVKFSGASWTKDNRGFFYSRYDEPTEAQKLTKVNEFQKLFYHRVGTDQSQDTLVYHRPDHKEWGFGGYATDDGQYLIIAVTHGTDPRNRVFYKDLAQPNSDVVELLNEFDASYDFVGNDGPVFWFKTDLQAPRARLIAIDTRNPARANWREIIPQAAETLEGVRLVGNRFIASYLKDAHSQVKVFNLDGSLERQLDLPGIGSASGFSGRREDTETFYSFTSFSVPGRIYRYSIPTGESRLWRQPQVAFAPDDFETHQVFAQSRDGTRIPIFITHRKGLPKNGTAPTLLYGYGGFNISITPSFSPANLAWMDMGGIYAVATLRGGGEYGEDWHQAGTKLQKQNVFDDFIAAAQWLIDNRYTAPRRLAIAGGSNGGLLVGACLTQRPDLFGACLPAVGVLDMLRFHLFTIGWAWKSDYGSAENPDEFRALYAYSPYHNLRPNTRYPATLITTADHDDRVVPAHSFKFAARLQECNAGPNPTLIRIETRAGHGAGKPTAKIIEEAADRWAFLVRTLDFKP